MVASAGERPDALLLAALAQAFSYPWEGVAVTLHDVRAWRAASPEAPLGSAVDNMLDASVCFESATEEQLAYTRLFIGSLKMLAPPYASFYMGREGTLNGKAAAEVASVYRQFGVRLSDDEIAPPDHLRYLLAFLAMLAARYEETGEDAFLEAYRDFIEAYMAPWFGQFRSLVERYADAPYYPMLIAVIGEAVMGQPAVLERRP